MMRTPHPDRRPARSSRAALLLGALLLSLPLLAALAAAPAQAAPTLEDYEVGDYGLGGDFKLSAADGKRMGPADWRGKVGMVFFGYTHCPDICPLTLVDFKKAFAALGADADQVQGVFISVDPERDTPELVDKYAKYFHANILGLSGTPQEIAQVAGQYSAVYKKMESNSQAGYLVGHSGFVYLMDRKGTVRYLMPHDVGADMLVQGLRDLMAKQ